MTIGPLPLRYAGICGSLLMWLSACSAGGASPTTNDNVDYGVCSMTSTTLFRIDRTAMTCTFVVLAPAKATCAFGVAGGGDWCLSMAGVSKDVAACDAVQIPANAVAATAAAGSFTTRVEDPAGPGGVAVDLADFDLTLTFPASADLPAAEHLVGTSCVVACVRPTSSCGT